MEDFQGQLLTDRYSLTDLHGQILIKNVYSSPLIKSKRAPVREGRVFHTETKQVQRNTERSGGLWCPGCKKMKCSKNTLTLIQTAYRHIHTLLYSTELRNQATCNSSMVGAESHFWFRQTAKKADPRTLVFWSYCVQIIKACSMSPIQFGTFLSC